MKDFRKLGIAAIMFMAAATTASAEDDKVEGSISADIVSQYIWRGQDCGHVSFQPSLGIEYKGLSLSAWGSIGISEPDDTREFDITLAYTIGGFNIGITDYWFDSDSDGNEYSYFKYCNGHGNHVFEFNVGYDFGPVALQWFTNFAGSDGTTDKGDRAYSSYFEISAPFTLGGLDWGAAVGISPFETTTYGNGGFAVINASLTACKDIKITDTFSIPVFAQIATNPNQKAAHFVFGFTLQP